MASWGDEATADDFLPPRSVAGPDEHGVKTITEYRRLPGGKKEKIVTRVKTVVVQSRLNAEIRRRKHLPKFGDAATATEGITLKSVDEIKIEKPGRSSDQDTAALVSQLQSAISKRGNNAGGAASNDFWAKKRENFNPSGISMEGGKAGVYVPKHKRGGGSSMANDRDNIPTLRVTNLSPGTMDEDVRDLFSRFGRVTRVYLAKTWVYDEETGEKYQKSRGFAFVSFESRRDGEKARKNLDRYPYDHLILRVEWAKPSVKKDAGAAGGLSGANTSGYGKKLPQTGNTIVARRD